MTITFQDLTETLAKAVDMEGQRLVVSPDDLENLRRQYAKARRLEGLPEEEGVDNAFCPGEGPKDNSCSSTKGKAKAQVISVGEGAEDFGDKDGPDLGDLQQQAWGLAKDSGIRILSDKDLTSVAVVDGKVAGGLFTAWTQDGKFSFDVVVDPAQQQRGIGSQLINDAMSQFRADSEAYDKPSIQADVVNPNLVGHLKKRGFKLKKQEGPHTIMIYK